MRAIEKWIWLDHNKYSNSQTTIFHSDACVPEEKVEKGNYTVNVIYEGNENFTGSFYRSDFKVSKISSNVTVKVNNITFNSSLSAFLSKRIF